MLPGMPGPARIPFATAAPARITRIIIIIAP
jgi:hypothetical protein